MEPRPRLNSDKACNFLIPDIARFCPPRDRAYRTDNKILAEFAGMRELRYLVYSSDALLSIRDRIYNGIFAVNISMMLNV